MTIHERMVARTEREKDLLKYGRSQERERIIKLLEEQKENQCKKAHCESIKDGHDYDCLSQEIDGYIALIKGEK